ncbi:hypothetical protein VPH35_041354 [Triticum aestivum]|uniref:procyclic form-specific polypeptide B-alpha n=1 Tax=Triticum aestivum TaxID=4565 RepID=UPI001D022A1E|nr:procyclic form-specific polypeptide B-alpha-like [Triticum aestivum]
MAATSSALLLLALVALAGLVDLQAFAAAPMPADEAEVSLAAATTTGMADPELDGTMQCLIGCFTTILGCAFKCLRTRKGIDLPLCVIGCNDRGIVCMFSCGKPPSPPGPKPTPPPAPTPTPPPAPTPTPPEPPAPTPTPPAPPAPKPKPPPAPKPKPPPPKPTPPYPPPAPTPTPTPTPPAPPTHPARRLTPMETSNDGDNYLA